MKIILGPVIVWDDVPFALCVGMGFLELDQKARGTLLGYYQLVFSIQGCKSGFCLEDVTLMYRVSLG